MTPGHILLAWFVGAVVTCFAAIMASAAESKRTVARIALSAPVWPVWIVVGLVSAWRTAELWPATRSK